MINKIFAAVILFVLVVGTILLAHLISHVIIKVNEILKYNPSGELNALAPKAIKKAMIKMGPYKDYRLYPQTGRLEVLVDGKWLRLEYNKEK